MKSKFKPEDDQKYYLHIPDADFSPERNKAIIQKTIQKHNAMIQQKGVEYRDDYMERADAVVSYLRFAEKKPGYRLDHYFEPKYIAFLRGDEIRRKLMANMTVLNSQGRKVN